MKRASFVVAAALIAAPATARAEPPDTAPRVAAPRAPEIDVSVGIRGMLLPSPGFDPYAGNDVLVQSAVTVGVSLLRAGHASVLLFAEWDLGSRSSSARGEDTSLMLNRFGGGVETRYQLGRHVYLSAKLAPAAFLLDGSITDPSLDRPLVAQAWTWALDASGGFGVLLGRTETRGVGFWVTGDLGYTWAGESAMSYAPAAEASDPRQFGSVMLPAMKPAGGMSRLGMAVSF
jgi:hypothetical protein